MNEVYQNIFYSTFTSKKFSYSNSIIEYIKLLLLPSMIFIFSSSVVRSSLSITSSENQEVSYCSVKVNDKRTEHETQNVFRSK